MKICLIQLPNYHTEISGFLIQYYNNYIIDIYHPHNKGDYSCFNYYSNLFNKKLNYINNVNFGSYNLIYFLTANDIDKFERASNYRDRIVVIPHTPKSIINQYINISLTPLINKYYCLPIYDIENLQTRNNIISVIGLTFNENRNMNDLKFLANNCGDYCINIYTRKFNNDEIINELRNYKKIKIFINLNTEQLIDYVRKSKYIYIFDNDKSWYRKDRLTGAIPLGYNNEVPLILSKKLNDIYNLNGNITYNESIIEVLNNILEMDNNQYKRLLYKMRICKKLIIEKNRKILSQLN